MDGSRFDAATRALGTRRGFVGLLAALAAGGAAREADAKKKCRSDSPAGQCCKKRNGVISCTCTSGGTVCGANCCLIGQDCRDGQCVVLPEPTTCIAYGEACKNVGKPCCESLVCGSGQGGETDVACYVRKTGRCASTAECTYGTECVDGICVGLPVCNVPLGEACTSSDICCTGTCGPVVVIGARDIETTDRCCVELGQACSSDIDCCQRFLPTAGRSPRVSGAICDRGFCSNLV